MHTTTSTTQLTPAEYEELSELWNRIERKWNVEVEDVSAQMSWCANIVKEVTFKDKPDSKPQYITLDWDSVMWADDGTELSAFETEKNVAEQIDYMIEYFDEEEQKSLYSKFTTTLMFVIIALWKTKNIHMKKKRSSQLTATFLTNAASHAALKTHSTTLT